MKTLIIISSIATGLLAISFFAYHKDWIKTGVYTLILAIIFCPISGILGYNFGIFNKPEVVKECPLPNCPTFEECKNQEPCPIYPEETFTDCSEYIYDFSILKENTDKQITDLNTEIELLKLAENKELISELKKEIDKLEIEKNEWWQKNYKCQEQLKILIN